IRQAFEQLYVLPEPHTAGLSVIDLVTMDVRKLARQKGISRDQEMHFISFANYPLLKYIENPPLGSIEQYPEDQGRKAVEILFELIDNKENQEAREVTLPTSLILK